MIKNKESGMTKEQYLDMMFQLGREPDNNEIPWEEEDFPFEVQQALTIYNMMPDRWEGMSGSYMGKEYSSLASLFSIYGIEEADKLDVLTLIKWIDNIYSKSINEKQQASKNKK